MLHRDRPLVVVGVFSLNVDLLGACYRGAGLARNRRRAPGVLPRLSRDHTPRAAPLAPRRSQEPSRSAPPNPVSIRCGSLGLVWPGPQNSDPAQSIGIGDDADATGEHPVNGVNNPADGCREWPARLEASPRPRSTEPGHQDFKEA